MQQRLVSKPKQKCRNENSRATKVQQRLVRTPKQKCRPIYASSNELDIRSCNESPNKLQLAFDHYFPVVLLIMLCDVGLAFEHSKAIEQKFLWCLAFIMLYKVALGFESVYKILRCDRSDESY